ncbi:MAG: hypothetical protein ACI8ZM_002670 [Crocinitomix sp.]|jgi:hypothetical protein
MKNLFFLFLFTIGCSFQASAQPPNYDDLLIYFADGDYEKLVSKAEKYIGNDKTKRDALPYLYCSMGYFEMSKDDIFEEDYPKAYNQAIGMAGKGLKKDKDGSMYADNIKYYTKIKESVVEEIQNMVDGQDYSRLRGTVMKLQRLDPADVGSHFLLAACQFQIKDKGSAKITSKEAQLRLDAVESVEDWREVDMDMLRIGVIEYARYFKQARQPEISKKILNKVKQWYEDDEAFMAEYDDIVNG